MTVLLLFCWMVLYHEVMYILFVTIPYSGSGCVFSEYIICLIKVTISCSFAYSHRNLLGRNQKLNVSLERGQIDSIFRINYTDPWIEGDDKRTSRSIMVQVKPLLGVALFVYLNENAKLSNRLTGFILC